MNPSPEVVSPVDETNRIPEAPASGLLEAIHDACRRMPPLWPLDRFVAVNPFVGMSDRHLVDVATLLARNAHGEILPAAADLLARLETAGIQDGEIASAAMAVARSVPPELRGLVRFSDWVGLRRALTEDSKALAATRVLSVADCLVGDGQGDWARFVVDEISKWCASFLDRGQSAWQMPGRDLGLYRAWKEVAVLDLNPDFAGLPQLRPLVRELPDDPLAGIGSMLKELGVSGAGTAEFLHRQLLSIAGWSGAIQFQVREANAVGRPDDSLIQLLAVRLAYDVALFRRAGVGFSSRWRANVANSTSGAGASVFLLARVVAQQALERRFQDGLITGIRSKPAALNDHCGRPFLQAVFCIDVRSEVYRRNLEAQSDRIQTLGFAGFFGMAIEHHPCDGGGGEARCPVLLTPKISVREVRCGSPRDAGRKAGGKSRLEDQAREALEVFKTSAVSCFPFVETLGVWFGAEITRAEVRSKYSSPQRRDSHRQTTIDISKESGPGAESAFGIDIPTQIALAEGALRNMGLINGFARVVLICGHGSFTTNNPYASSLGCGACGGYPGDANAKVAAAILNQPAVRQGLRDRGILVPDDTIFLAGLHDTTTDEVEVYGLDELSPEHRSDTAKILGWLEAASRDARRQRAPALGLDPKGEAELDRSIFRRAQDWAEVRPEWGLAGNAALVAAPRSRTRHLDLGGRVFLHDYDPDRDPTGSVLELILCAPVVVASWINLQYYASTVDNRVFGSGDKVLHNVVGKFGVWQGNAGDLQVGLPMQSLHDGVRWVHEPLRLSVVIEARREAIDAVLLAHPEVAQLFDNGWIHLLAIEPKGTSVWRHAGPAIWDEMPAGSLSVPTSSAA